MVGFFIEAVERLLLVTNGLIHCSESNPALLCQQGAIDNQAPSSCRLSTTIESVNFVLPSDSHIARDH